MSLALRTSPAVRGVALLLVAPTVVLGWWLGTHAQTNPSGGFQGGVVLATAFMLVYLSGDLRTARRLRSEAVVDAAEAIGAGGFAAVGVTAVALGFPTSTTSCRWARSPARSARRARSR